MARCESCGNECTLPFTCQHCGGKFCPECRLPPNHQCTALTSWQKKPVPGVGIRYERGSGVTATSGGFAEARHTGNVKRDGEIPWLKLMIAIMLIALLIILVLTMSGYPF
jgi:hypothetical protein